MDISRITASIWPWGTQSREQMEQAAKEVSEIGYKHFESVKKAIYAFDMDLKAYQEVLKRYDLTPVSFYFHLPLMEEMDEFFATLDKEFDFIANLGVERLSLQPTRTRPEVMDEPKLAQQLEAIMKFAEKSKKYGIITNLHPHSNTWVLYENEIDYAMKNSDPKVLSFVPDTAHLVVGLCDPVEIIRRYVDRINFTHFKDIASPEVESDGIASAGMEIYKNFRELGQGCVDFKTIFGILKEHGYNGYLCEELDRAPISNAISAKNNFEYLKNNY